MQHRQANGGKELVTSNCRENSKQVTRKPLKVRLTRQFPPCSRNSSFHPTQNSEHLQVTPLIIAPFNAAETHQKTICTVFLTEIACMALELLVYSIHGHTCFRHSVSTKLQWDVVKVKMMLQLFKKPLHAPYIIPLLAIYTMSCLNSALTNSLVQLVLNSISFDDNHGFHGIVVFSSKSANEHNLSKT